MTTFIHYRFMAVMTATLLATSSCNYHEDDLEPSGLQTSFQLPQGSSEADKAIRQFYANYGKYILYDFTDKDVYWTPTSWTNGEPTTETSEGKPGFYVKKADTQYIGSQLTLLNEVWFDLCNESAKKQLLPTLIFLCSEVNTLVSKYVFTPSFHMEYQPLAIGAKYNYAGISVTYGSESILSVSAADKKELQRTIIDEWTNYISERLVPAPTDFLSMVNYTDQSVTQAYSPIDCCAVGTLEAGYSGPDQTDWPRYLKMIMMFPESYLTEDPGDISSWSSWTEYDFTLSASVFNYDRNFHGILHPTKDTKGMVRKRYDFVRNYFIQHYQVDLQGIGNKVIQ